ncbi:MAG: P-loop NTPase [Bacteroidales bacterium]|jgi:MinD superfamily P-loop ATPase
MIELVVLSGKGGTGKTSLSAALATLGPQGVVADCDVDAANLHLILQPDQDFKERFVTGCKAVINNQVCSNCGLCIDYCRFDAIAYKNGQVTISGIACDGCKLCSRICPSHAISMVESDKSFWYSGSYRNGFMVHARLAPGEENSGKLVNVVREQARKISGMTGLRTIIIDGPPGTGCPAISSLTGTNKAIIVTEPTRSGFHDLKRILELTSGFKQQSYVVINKYDLNESITSQITGWCSEAGIPVIGKIPFDEKIVEAMLYCQSITEWAPESEVSKEIHSIYKQVLND